VLRWSKNPIKAGLAKYFRQRSPPRQYTRSILSVATIVLPTIPCSQLRISQPAHARRVPPVPCRDLGSIRLATPGPLSTDQAIHLFRQHTLNSRLRMRPHTFDDLDRSRIALTSVTRFDRNVAHFFDSFSSSRHGPSESSVLITL